MDIIAALGLRLIGPGDTLASMRKASAIRRGAGQTANIIASRLRVARSLQTPPLSMEETAQRATLLSGYHISRDMIVRIENRHRSVYDYEVYALALALNVDVRFLMGLSDDPGKGQRLQHDPETAGANPA